MGSVAFHVGGSVVRGLECPLPPLNVPEPPKQFVFSGRLLMVDQAIAKAGWVIIDFKADQFKEQARGMWKAPEPIKGHKATLEMATQFYHYFIQKVFFYCPDQVVHEMPPVGSAMIRPESSLVAATALRLAAAKFAIPVEMIGAQKAKKRWTGYANAQKSEVREAILMAYPEFAQQKPWNQDVCDAVALGLTWAEKKGK